MEQRFLVDNLNTLELVYYMIDIKYSELKLQETYQLALWVP